MNIFNTVRVERPQYSTFDLGFDMKLSFKMGKLVPVWLQETLPGDRFNISQEAMFRLMPMIAPIMHKVDVYFHTFFVPNRILWSNWEKFITGGQIDDVAPAFPVLNPNDTTTLITEPSSLADYLGCPVGGSPSAVNALPFAAYQRIWYEFYRDQNLQDEPGQVLQDGVQNPSNTAALTRLHVRCWEHDYFTSALPFAQKGAAVELPITLGNITIDSVANGNAGIERNAAGGAAIGGPTNRTIQASGETSAAGVTPTYYDPNGTLITAPSATGGLTINEFREARALQVWLEKNARGGTRYTESLLDHFGVRSSDSRLQRPEYLGGSKATMAISEVLQTSSTDATTPQGNMAGHGISVSGGSSYSYRCEEHGYLMTLLSIRPKTAYYAGLPRHFWKNDRFDFYWPAFAALGEQPIYKGEVCLDVDPIANNQTFGYIPRYSEYRYNPSRIAGQMATSLEYWHMARKFSVGNPAPPLNADFVNCDPTKRIFAVTDPEEDEVIGHVFHKIYAQRPLPKYGTPSTL